ncbi:hypothetical protein [Methanosarcina sp.]|uniref:hypothetical protein n=1 Tax=Methanosarcina sp. TaxID=2213 RepID=UPI002988CB1B|nr:hypothetical protein [Methanosarcina sp.]MDW5548978.1 hypothetical protein [Methanosarcina sp.]MDW5552681.1 hypothetical protein [Methanosarcina sp.]MDW5559237.1 hypothetical protein [Methanosarcina sp.]
MNLSSLNIRKNSNIKQINLLILVFFLIGTLTVLLLSALYSFVVSNPDIADIVFSKNIKNIIVLIILLFAVSTFLKLPERSSSNDTMTKKRNIICQYLDICKIFGQSAAKVAPEYEKEIHSMCLQRVQILSKEILAEDSRFNDLDNDFFLKNRELFNKFKNDFDY